MVGLNDGDDDPSGWDKNEVTRRGRGGPGTVLLVLE